jgi:hypothetical protein
MTTRLKLMLVAVAVLVVVNIWRWLPEQQQPEKSAASVETTVVDAFDLRLAGHESLNNITSRVTRDLFSPVVVGSEAVTEKPVARKPQKQDTAPSQRQQILKRLAEFKLVGILLQNGIKHAFLTRDEEHFTVARGDRVDKGYIVEDVTLTSVTLSEAKSRVSKKIELE